MKIAFVSVSHLHVDMYLDRLRSLLGGVSAYAIWDEDCERVRALCAREAARFVADLDDLLADEAIDGFVICSENVRLLPLLSRVVSAGKPIFCEKPLVIDLKGVAEFETLSRQSSAAIVTGYFQPYLGMMKAIRSAVDSGELGSVLRVRYRNTRPAALQRWFDKPGAEWFVDRELAGGGGFLDLGSHAIHCVRSLFGPVASVWACIDNYSGAYPSVDDFGHALLKMESGVVVSIEAGWIQNGGIEGIEIVGTQKSIWNTTEGYVCGSASADSRAIVAFDDDPVRMDRLLAAIRNEISEEALAHDLACGFDAVRILDAAYRSTDSGAWVRCC